MIPVFLRDVERTADAAGLDLIVLDMPVIDPVLVVSDRALVDFIGSALDALA